MTKPAEKAPEIRDFLDSISGRSFAINADVCVGPPIGCGGDATEFRNEISRKEYTLSGWCQNCQDNFFGKGDEE